MISKSRAKSRWAWRVGVVGSGLWLGFFIGYSINNWPSILQLSPHEFGDFIAGIFAPPAFLWIVVGYIMQAAEFEIQVVELAKNVEANTQLVSTAKAAYLRETALAHPKFAYGGLSSEGTYASMFMINKGTNIYKLRIGNYADLPSFQYYDLHAAESGDGGRVTVIVASNESGWVRFNYLDKYSDPGFVWVHFRAVPPKICSRIPGEDCIEDPVELEEWLAIQ